MFHSKEFMQMKLKFQQRAKALSELVYTNKL